MNTKFSSLSILPSWRALLTSIHHFLESKCIHVQLLQGNICFRQQGYAHQNAVKQYVANYSLPTQTTAGLPKCCLEPNMFTGSFSANDYQVVIHSSSAVKLYA